MPDTEYFIGIQGGAHHSVAVAVDTAFQYHAVAQGDGMPFHQMHDKGDLVVPFVSVLRQLSEKLGLSGDQALRDRTVSLFLVLPGVFRPQFREAAIDILAQHDWLPALNKEAGCAVLDDTEAVLYASGNDGAGVALVCGSGCAVYARTCDGRDCKIDGWGPLLGDDGSGFYLGLKGLRAVLCGADWRGEPCPTLRQHIFSALPQVSTEPDLITWLAERMDPLLGHAFRRDVSDLAVAVTSAASAGERTAMRILEKGVWEILRTVCTAHRRLGLPPDCPIYLEGGALDGDHLYARLVRKGIQDHFRDAVVSPVPYQPAVGALYRAALLQQGITHASLIAEVEPLLAADPHLASRADMLAGINA